MNGDGRCDDDAEAVVIVVVVIVCAEFDKFFTASSGASVARDRFGSDASSDGKLMINLETEGGRPIINVFQR